MGESSEYIANHYAHVAHEANKLAHGQKKMSAFLQETKPTINTPLCCDLSHDSEASALYTNDMLSSLPIGALLASRGCGDPVTCANLKPGERVLDLGSGGGIDALIAARLVGAGGFVYGLDMTSAMVELAQSNAEDADITNVRFLEGNIECIPLPNASIDAIISNCVINLCEDKATAFAEARRVLVPGGRLIVSDIVAFRPIPSAAHQALCELTGCRGGITDTTSYEHMLNACGFSHVTIDRKTLYTDTILEEKAHRKNSLSTFEHARANGAGNTAGSAIIRGYVEEGQC